jgi:hypothetical protein
MPAVRLVVDGLTVVLIVYAMLTTGAFWGAAILRKGSRVHITAGRWFARIVHLGVVIGAALAIVMLAWPSFFIRSNATAASVRHLIWLGVYLLLVLETAVQHGIAAVAAGPLPMTMRSRRHASLNTGALVSTLVVFPAAIVWQDWMLLFVTPLGFIVSLRNMLYTSQTSATPQQWQREHLTSLVTAGMTLHAGLVVLVVLIWPDRFGIGWLWLCFVAPWAVGLLISVWLRAVWQPGDRA